MIKAKITERYHNNTVACTACGKITRRVYCSDSSKWKCRCGKVGYGTKVNYH